MRRPIGGYTPKQYAYAMRRLTGDGKTKEEIALLSGYSKGTATNTKHAIEESSGYQNAVMEIARESNNLVLATLAEYNLRGLEGFTNQELNAALNAITSAWEKFDKAAHRNEDPDAEKNPLRKLFMQRVENQTINVPPGTSPDKIATIIHEAHAVPVKEEKKEEEKEKNVSEEKGEELDLDF